jgi:DNA-binding CsgD family transcriptional regulator
VLVGRAARAALAAGATQRAAGLLDDALLHQASAEETARLLWLRGRVQHALGDPDRELDFFLQAVDLSRDPEVRVWAAAEGLLAAMYADRPDQASRMAALARAHHDPNDRTHRFLVAHAEGAAHSLNHDAAAAAGAMATARALLAEGLLDDVPELLLWAVNLDLFDRRDPATTPELYAALDRVRDSGDLTWLPRVTHLLAGREALTGHRAASDALLVEAELTSRLSGQHTQLLEALVARAEEDALRGDDEALAARLDEAVQVAARVGTRWLEDSLDDARMRAAMTRGEHATVATLARSLLDSDPDLLAVLVDAVRRTDGVEGARAELAAHADLLPAALTVARAVVEDDPDVLVDAADETGDHITAAWLLLAAGERYRRAGRRRDARAALQRAAALYESLGAEPWVARAREELRASGATLRRRDQGDALTPSERRIAELAAEGRSNKEVATALFLSPKTVEFHLGNAYRKLGVGNRTELAVRLRDETVNRAG